MGATARAYRLLADPVRVREQNHGNVVEPRHVLLHRLDKALRVALLLALDHEHDVDRELAARHRLLLRSEQLALPLLHRIQHRQDRALVVGRATAVQVPIDARQREGIGAPASSPGRKHVVVPIEHHGRLVVACSQPTQHHRVLAFTSLNQLALEPRATPSSHRAITHRVSTTHVRASNCNQPQPEELLVPFHKSLEKLGACPAVASLGLIATHRWNGDKPAQRHNHALCVTRVYDPSKINLNLSLSRRIRLQQRNATLVHAPLVLAGTALVGELQWFLGLLS